MSKIILNDIERALSDMFELGGVDFETTREALVMTAAVLVRTIEALDHRIQNQRQEQKNG